MAEQKKQPFVLNFARQLAERQLDDAILSERDAFEAERGEGGLLE
jgi:hypothetical protein